ncbi:hypothetical protein LTS17_002854 [Exophiala oligosperma]
MSAPEASPTQYHEKLTIADEVQTIERLPIEDDEFSEDEIRKVRHKVDRRLISVCALLVMISLLDRSNLSNANIAGMSKDLELTVGTRYSIIVLSFFAPYIVAEIPCAYLVRKAGLRWSLPTITLAWGVVMLGFGFVHNWTVLIGLRIILGILEAGLFPALAYLLSLWYTRYEVHQRYAIYYMIGLGGSSLGGVLAYAFMQMKGVGGLAAWRWIFIMEALLTIVVAGIAFVLLVDYPQNAHKAWNFLTQREATMMLRRVERDRGDTEEDQEFELSRFLRPALDLRVWGYGMIWCFSTMPAYAVAYFLPQILNRELGFSTGVAQLLSTPPYIFAGLQMWFEGWLCDKIHRRFPVLLWNPVQTIVGLCLLSWTHTPGVQYFGAFLVTAGCNSNIPAVMAWQANNIRGHWTRMFCSAVLVSAGGLGGIIGALVFRSQDAPKYLPGMIACIVASGIVFTLTCSMVVYFIHANRQVTQGKRVIARLPNFKYTL